MKTNINNEISNYDNNTIVEFKTINKNQIESTDNESDVDLKNVKFDKKKNYISLNLKKLTYLKMKTL